MNRPLLRETIAYRPMRMETRELPSRRRSLWTLTTSLMAGASAVAGLVGGEPPVAPRPRGTHPTVREIHKNAWLKRQTSVDKKGAHFSKKGEKFWVVFCVHDDSEALLEFYTEPKMATLHKPLSAISLNCCLHVSPSIVAGQDNEYQFAVTLQTEVIRLVAANWEQMIEWVESLQGKLREMNILSPKDNLYSKLPEVPPSQKIIAGLVASTRDPNSPLPPTPSTNQQQLLQNATRVVASSNQNASSAGNARTEQSNRRSAESSSSSNSHHANASNSAASRVNGNSAGSSTSSSTSNSHHHNHNERESSRQNRNNLLVDLSDSPRSRTQAMASSSSGESSGVVESSSDSQQASKRKQQKISVKVSVDVVANLGGHSRSQSSQRQQNGVSTSATTTVVVIGNGDVRIQSNGDGPRVSRNGEVSTSASLASSVVVSSGSGSGANTEIMAATVAGSQQGSHNVQNQSQNGPENNCVSRVAVNGVKVSKPKPKTRTNAVTATSNGDNNGEMVVSIESAMDTRVTKAKAAASVGKRSCSSENIYEHIYIPEGRPVVLERTNHHSSSNGVKCNNGNNHLHHQPQVKESGAHRSAAQRSPEEDNAVPTSREQHTRRLLKGHNGGSNQRSSSLGRIEILPTTSGRSIAVEASHARSQDHHRDRQEPSRGTRSNGNRNHPPGEEVLMTRSIGNSTFFASNGAQLQGSPLDALIGSRNGEYRLRRDDYLIRSTGGDTSGGNSSGSGSDNDNHHGSSHTSSNDLHTNGGHLPLKEQQVMHLQMEINHPGGVRVILRKKDCLSSIAFVDYLGAVWVAGWKQTQFPVLYYGFHVGDQILKVAGVNVQSSIEASRAIKMVSSMQVEFIIRRLPYGRVFALKRTRDGEPLGLVAEGGSGEISEVLPDGLAARYGLPPKGLSVDGQSPCNWYLTEVNNRPLSLMSKENEVKDRLNAVGKEISILVQPADLVKHLRKSLKCYKGFKDYVVG